MPENEVSKEIDLASLRNIRAETGNNAVADHFLNLIEQTYNKSPYVSDTYLAPYNPDDLYQKNFDYTIYENMMNDDQVNVCMRLKKDLVLGEGGHIVPTDEDQEEIVEDIEKALFHDYEGSLMDDLEEIITSYEFGFSLTEKIFKTRENAMLGLKALKTRHPNSWLIYQDDHGNVTKYLQKTVAGDIEVNPKSIIHNINDRKFSNPYGTSDLRSAYNAWITKTHIVRFFAIFLEKAASPIPVGRYDKNAPNSAVDKLFDILKRFQTKTAITIPKDVEIEFLDAKNNGEVYHKAIHLFNMFIGRALFIPDLLGFTGGETGGGSLALGKEQMSLFFMHIVRRRKALEDIINKELIRPIVNYNWGILEKYPEFKFKPIDDMKAVELAKIWLEAVKGAAFQPNEDEINHFRKLVKFPEGDVVFKQSTNPFGQKSEVISNETEQDEPKEELDDEKSQQETKAEDKKDFAKAYDQTPGDYHRKVDFKKMKTKLDDYDNSVMNESQAIVKKMIIDLMDQIEKKKIVQGQNVDRIDSLSLKYKKELKQILKNSFYQLYKDSISQAQTEISKSEFKKPLVEDAFLDVVEKEAFNFVGDYEYGILKRTRTELIAAIKDGRQLSTVESVLTEQLKSLSEAQIERFARTKHTEVMNAARHDFFESTGVVTGYQYSAIMDDRTSDICSGLHGKFFKSGEEPIPPLHFNCRSTLIPITKYEEFKPTESIRGMSPQDFIDEYKGEGFSTK